METNMSSRAARAFFEAVPQNPTVLITAGLLAIVTAAVYLLSPGSNRAPALGETIPYFSNAYQYMTDMRSFLARAGKYLRSSSVVRFRLGPKKVYLVTKASNMQVLFRTTANVDTNIFFLMIQENLWASSKRDLDRFRNDPSGRLKNPAPGTEHIPAEKRYWAGLHHIFHEYLARTHESNALAANFQRQFAARLEERFPAGEWAAVRILEFVRADMTMAATTTLAGPRMLGLNPNLLRELWDFDEIAASLVWGLPKWINREAWKKRDRFNASCVRYLEDGWKDFDWDGPAASASWEPVWGSRYVRELVRWMRQCGFDKETMGGAMMILVIFGTNGNTIPIVAWCLIELVKDKDLLARVRAEIETTYVTDSATGTRTIDPQALVALPLFQSVFVEILRLHVSMNVTREAVGPITLGGYEIEKGAVLQAPTEISHFDEGVWGAPGHPAAEFWAERHLQYVDAVDEKGQVTRTPQFSMTGRSNDFFPFGGGVSICPGRFFAKQEIMLTAAMLVSRFDIEFVEWTTLDGSPSDRPAQNDVRWSGGASVPPDRDMKVRWRRRW
ncbi:putative cytochrome P450 E-class, group IV [Echria macrotheca]|uniref:Cytochrome P450 E-class, group IV n=1 Tax=Echria macrotheca TaxID=438768 RepID=A0AAJ0B5C7_9PEZI|nr:putative cytochrome P450 E-class, group IV [Echria macrotheca]